MAGNEEGGEVTLTAAIGKLLDSGEYSDVELVATDGERIPAHRNILAARSKVFGTLLFGNFAESSSSTVQMGYEGGILRKIVKYCYTDKVSLPDASESAESSSFDTQQVLRLVDAADYFNLPGLVTQISEWSMTQMKNDFEMQWQVLVYCDENPTSSVYQTGMYKAAIQTVQQEYGKILQRSDEIPRLSPEFLERILACRSAVPDEIDRFYFIRMWCSGGSQAGSAKDSDVPVTQNGDSASTKGTNSSEEAGTPQEESARIIAPPQKRQKTGQDNETQSEEERRNVACALIRRHVRLASIKLQHLQEEVEPSGLVTADGLLEAYKSHAIWAEMGAPPLLSNLVLWGYKED
jgi:hypothetical protein